ncbi:MAG: ribonuclease HI family protein [Candidatus Micrarchaeota archaeon]|nr:ribonuclease HI family protein [Candidatus Micrarchaeota archaeon]
MADLTIYTDGAARGNPGPSASGYAIYRGTRLVAEYYEFNGDRTNNYAEYRAMIMALEWCRDNVKDPGEASIEIRSDSELVVRQMNLDYKVKSGNLIDMNRRLHGLVSGFGSVGFTNLPRSDRYISAVDKRLNDLLDRHGQTVK